MLRIKPALLCSLLALTACQTEGQDPDCADCAADQGSTGDASDGADIAASDSGGTSTTSDMAATDAGVSDDASNPDDQGTTPGSCDMGELRAFPGAVGFGAGTSGGRGGDVYVVNTLDDSGPGSLREAVEATGARTVVFAVGGTITLEDVLVIENSNITINGATAPGGGIALRTTPAVTGPAIRINADDVVLRYLRVRPGASAEPSANVDALTITGGSNMMIANSSFSWATDEVVNLWYDPSDITLQDNLISEGLWNSTHPNGAHSKGFLAGPDAERISMVRNVFASNDDRNPQFQSLTSYELINNIGYNGYQVGATLVVGAGSAVNMVGNVYLPGPDYRPSRYQIIVSEADAQLPDAAIYVDDNITPRSSVDDPWAAMGWGGVHDGGDYNGSPAPASVRAATPFAMSPYPATTVAAAMLEDALLPKVGASKPTRDSADARVVADIVARSGRLIDSPDEVGGWPTLAAGQPAADADNDGIPDAWETANGLDPNDPADSRTDRNADGYTNIEEYLECP